MQTQPAGRQNINIISIILTSSPAMYSFMTKFYFHSLPFYTDSVFPKAVRGKSSNPYDCYFFTVKSLIDTGYFFIYNYKFFHRFSTEYSLNNNISNCNKICV